VKKIYNIVFTLIALYASLKISFPYLDVITYAAISATLFYPLYHRLKKYHRELAAFGCTSLIFVAVIIPITYTAIFLIAQTDEAYRFLVSEKIVPPIPAVKEVLETSTVSILQENSQALSIVMSLVARIPGLLVKLLLFTFLTYYFFYDGTKIKKFVRGSFGSFGKILVERGELHLREVVFGNFLTTGIIAAISVFIMWIWEIPYAFTLGALVGISAIMPLVAVWMVLLPLAFIYYPTKPLFALMVIFYAAIVGAGTFDVFVRNKLVKGMHPAVFTIGFFGGLASFGIAGMFIGPVVLSLSLAIIETYTMAKV